MTPRNFLLLLGLALLSGPGCAEELGRLFFSPQERLELDRRGVVHPAARGPSGARAPESIRLDGIIRRADGSATVWINGREVPPAAAKRLSGGTAAAVTLPDGHRVRLKVGDVAPLPPMDEATPGDGQ